VSRYNDINQLLEEIGTSARSAGDPWTLSRSYRGTVKQDAFSPGVVADFGAPSQDLTSGIRASENIARADAVISPSTGAPRESNSSSSSGLLGGLLNFFPLASGIAKLFGFGTESSSQAVLTPFQPPPSISFEGAMSNSTSGVTSLSYGADGLPRTASRPGPTVTNLGTTTRSSFSNAPMAEDHLTSSAGSTAAIKGQLNSLAQSNLGGLSPASAPNTISSSSGNSNFAGGNTSTADFAGQLAALSTSPFEAEPAPMSPNLSVVYGSQSSLQNPSGSSPSRSETNPPGSDLKGSSTAESSTQQGNSILVQVQAMDSQSFMDHSHDIAQAVRQAMLNLNSLNDVILDL
jgi:hypothetical protein